MEDIGHGTSFFAKRNGEGKMILFDRTELTEGYVARHIPMGTGAPGREAAITESQMFSYVLYGVFTENGCTLAACCHSSSRVKFAYCVDKGVQILHNSAGKRCKQ